MTQLSNSWGERWLLWHCRLIWGGSLYPKSKTPRGRMVGLSGHPCQTPQDPGREAESPGSGLPLHKYSRGRGSSKELSQRLSSQRSSFQGNVSPSASTEEPPLSPPQRSWTPEPQTSFPNMVCLVSLLHLCDQTLLWEDQAGSAPPWCPVTTQTSMTTVSNRLMMLQPWLEKQRCNILSTVLSFYCLSVSKLHSFQKKHEMIKNNPQMCFFLLLLLSFHKPKRKRLTTLYGYNAMISLNKLIFCNEILNLPSLKPLKLTLKQT